MWRRLVAGNARFVAGNPEHPGQDADRRREVANGQQPLAVVFGCSDSRVAAEIVFDQGLGDLFMVRTAGHVLDAAVLGSIEYGVAVLGAPLVIVLGHDRCGAVGAALEAQETGVRPPGPIGAVVARVLASIEPADGAPGHSMAPGPAGERHIRHTVAALPEASPALAAGVAAGTCAIIGVRYTLAEGRIEVVAGAGPEYGTIEP